MFSSTEGIPRIPESIDFPVEEGKILLLWKELDVFQNCLRQSTGKPRFSFFDGPPFATGLPHYGHILAGTVKDIVTRFAHQQGFHVERRFGWDCHGLPIEFEIDKALGIKSVDDVNKIGLDKYNDECRKIVTRYVDEWKVIMWRLGRWIDFDHDYKTLYPWFMESVWWVFKQLFLKGLVYYGIKIMPYSTACRTPLSNFESGQNYKEITDPALTVSLPIIADEQGSSLLIWTTTPWTLPCNLAVCVNAKLIYCRIKEVSTGNIYVLLRTRAEAIFPNDQCEVLEEFPGGQLRNLTYEPPFCYFDEMKNSGAFRVLTDDYVTAESGTGIVHMAPYFGEDDFRVCVAAGVIKREQPMVCPIDPNGMLTSPLVDFEGQYFKDADKKVIAILESKGRIVRNSRVKHSYPFCWRSDTPLIYRAIPSWFIRVEHMSELLQNCSSETYWVPACIKDKRFGNWLKDARDWAVSRNRYWGTPIPIWTNGRETCCVGSIEELEELTGENISDLHRENIDHLEIPSRKPGNPPLCRIGEVFDCWFESGSMPYAQQHYPFENVKEFQESFPADFIAEGIDQTRGWFYTLLVISVALFGKAPFKNLVANGLILASDGQKMSKRKKNYPDPMEMVDKYGADALRLYLINSPVVRAENLRFKEGGVRDIIKDVFLPWFNAFRFLMQNIEMYAAENDGNVSYFGECEIPSPNIMDRWILSFTHSLLAHVHKEMALYHLYNVVPSLVKYFDHLTNWYVRMNRKRLKGDEGTNQQKHALRTLHKVLLHITLTMSPFVPFFSEFIYQHLRNFTKNLTAESVHFLMLPNSNPSLIIPDLERTISRLQEVIELARLLRDKKNIPLKYPLPELIVISQNVEYINDILSLEDYVLSEMNVRTLSVTNNKEQYGIKLQGKPDYKTLGQRFKGDYKTIAKTIEQLTNKELLELTTNGSIAVGELQVEASFVRIGFKSSLAVDYYEMETKHDVMVLLNVLPNQEMLNEGAAREIVNRIQKLRKKSHLVPSDNIDVFYKATSELKDIAETYTEFIEKSIKTRIFPIEYCSINDQLISGESKDFKGCNLKILLTKKTKIQTPVVKWANLVLDGFQIDSKGLTLLEIGNRPLTFNQLKWNISTVFNIYCDFILCTASGGIIAKDDDIAEFPTSSTIFIQSLDGKKDKTTNNSTETFPPFCKILNFFERGVLGTIILENPVGVPTVLKEDYPLVINDWIKVVKEKSEKNHV